MLVDALGTLAVVGDAAEFRRAVRRVIEDVSFDVNTTVQVFEANIRGLGGLLSAHLLIEDPGQRFGALRPEGYSGELLAMAADLGSRLLPALQTSPSGLPLPRVHLRSGTPQGTHTCTAGAGSLLVEFGVLSRLTGDPTYGAAAARVARGLRGRRHHHTGLLGSTLNTDTGQWTGVMSGVGAGLDSYYEYLLKAYVLFGDPDHLAMWAEAYAGIQRHMRRGRVWCHNGTGPHPTYANVDMATAQTANNWMDSLQAAFAGLQVLAGDVEEAICSHALYWSLWQRYGVLPERYNWLLRQPEVLFYPHVGRHILSSLSTLTRAPCGHATLHSVLDGSQEDRMESFFLSETCKYLYLLFDEANPANIHARSLLFTTEGHILPLGPWLTDRRETPTPSPRGSAPHTGATCSAVPRERRSGLPLAERYWRQLYDAVGL